MKKKRTKFSDIPIPLAHPAITHDTIQSEKRLRLIGTILSILCAFLSSLSLFGYFIENPAFYRPFNDGPATHPLTATSILLISSAIVLAKVKKHRAIEITLLTGAITLLLINLTDPIFSHHLVQIVTPFNSVVDNEIAHGLSNSMGINTSLMLLPIAISTLFLSSRTLLISQILAFLSLAFPMVSLIGYLYQLDSFYGQMSLFTSLYGLVLCIATLLFTTSVGALKAILSPHVGGRIARYQAVLGFIVPVLLGFIFVKSISAADAAYIGMFVMTFCWFSLSLVSVSAIYQEKADIKRREAEWALHIAATHDALTQLPNRRQFFLQASLEFDRVKRTKSEIWLMVLDIDHFKQINDSAGHQAGDQVLMKLADIIRNTLRVTDHKCRLGGEEFAILLPDSSAQKATTAAQKLRCHIEQAKIEQYTEQYGAVTTSIGLAKAGPDDTINTLLVKADKAMYQAKNNGRNQVFVNEQ